MKTKLVNFKLPLELIEQIEKMSEGNKTALVTDLLKQAISLRSIPDHHRQRMYSALKRINYEEGNNLEEDHVYMRNLIDGLWI